MIKIIQSWQEWENSHLLRSIPSISNFEVDPNVSPSGTIKGNRRDRKTKREEGREERPKRGDEGEEMKEEANHILTFM